VDVLRNHWRFESAQKLPKFWAFVFENPATFIERVAVASREIADYTTGEQQLFNAIEIINRLCLLYSEMFYAPFKLTALDGFLIPAVSSRELVRDSLIPAKNPYLTFLKTHCFEYLKEFCPDVIFLHGRPHISTTAIAYQAKIYNPNVHICLCESSNEYFSLSKLTPEMERNEYFFHVVDSVVPEGKLTEETLKRIVQNPPPKGSIICDNNAKLSFKDNLTRGLPSQEPIGTIALEHTGVACGKLFPNLACPWRRCAFCGINAKYANDYSGESAQDKITVIKELIASGVKYFWFYDEAVSVDLLREFAQTVIDGGLEFTWHIRSRLDEDFDLVTCRLLALAGLREIRFGLETASPEVQKVINKFESFSLSRIEEIVSNFDECAVGVHFPCIIGLPRESKSQRQETYDFLKLLRDKYPLFSFNINVLELDVASDFYKYPDKFGIVDIKLPCDEEFFVGNTALTWNYTDAPFDKEALWEERENVMKELLYPWMPTGKLTQVWEFYRIAENLRLTLRFKQLKNSRETR
jgi:hypothetical protein